MKRAFIVLGALLVGCSSNPPPPSSTAPASSASSARAPSQNEQLYAQGAEHEKAGRWEEAANTYQKYVLAMGDGLSYMDRSSMELRIKQLREKVWPKPEGKPQEIDLKGKFEPAPIGACAKPYYDGHYADAVACWRADYVERRNPYALLFAARAYELDAKLDAAVLLYERFLQAADVGGDARTLRNRIQIIREKIAERRADAGVR